MKRVKKVGLQKEYTRSPFANTTVRRLFALSFIQPTEVAGAVNLIEQEMPNSNVNVLERIQLLKTWTRFLTKC